MEKESIPPPYPGTQATQASMNFPGQQTAYTAHAGELVQYLHLIKEQTSEQLTIAVNL